MNIWTWTARDEARARFVSVALAASTLAPAIAQADEPVAQVVVRGTSAGGFSSRAALDDQPRQVADVAELLEPIAGIHVRRQGGEDSFATLSIRGTSSSEVAVVLAGVPLTGGADPSLDLGSLPLWPGAEARVYRSFAPASLGPGSLGGTLALDPPSTHAPERSEVWVGAGSYGAARLRVGDIRELPGGGRIALGLSASRATDDFSYFLADNGPLTTQHNAEHASGQALVSYSLPFVLGHREGELSVTTLVQARKQHLPGTIQMTTPYEVLASDRELGSVQMSLAAGPGAAYARVWGRRDDLRLSDDAATALLQGGATREDDAILATGGAVGWRGAPVRSVHLTLQGDASGERFSPGDVAGIALPASVTRASVGGGGDVAWNVTSKWTLAATARADIWNDAVGAAAVASEATSGEHAEFHPTGHVGSEIALGPVSLAAHGGALARPPSFLERYGDRGTFVGNPSLMSETAWTVDAGARVAGKSAHGLLSGQMDISGFATWADDLITFVNYGSAKEKATNIGRARMVGLEVAANGTAGPFFGRVAWTELSTANLVACTSLAADGSCAARPPLPGRPALDLVSDAGILAGPLRLRYGVDVTSGQYADDLGGVHVPARILQSTGAALDIPHVPGLRFVFDVRNLFDVRTVTYAGFVGPVREPIGDAYLYPLPGRTVFASLRYVQSR